MLTQKMKEVVLSYRMDTSELQKTAYGNNKEIRTCKVQSKYYLVRVNLST